MCYSRRRRCLRYGQSDTPAKQRRKTGVLAGRIQAAGEDAIICYRNLMSATKIAFDAARRAATLKSLPLHMVANPDECVQMQSTDGIHVWRDGPVPVDASTDAGIMPPLMPATFDKRLWVVNEQVLFASEYCDFGDRLASKKVKHSNLTGGGHAYSGGEFVPVDSETLIINGCSGRYGSKTPQEFEAFVRAFRNSGYHVWSMGWDTDGDKPMPFGPNPLPVAAD